eukprot:scaffold789_cov261-Pinguiococcus_pyrenoidosus.AAC.14
MNYLDDFDTRKCTSCIRCNLRLWKELGIAKEQKSKQTHSRPVGRAVPAPAKRSRKDVIVLDGGLDNGDALPGNRAAARCYRCNQIGHYANACPENASGRGEEGRSSVCYNCNQPGHFANQCPQARQRGAGGGSGGGTFVNGGATNPMVCFVCQAPGHYASECPQRINRGARTNPAGDLTRRALPLSGTCFKCKQSGHFANQCPNADVEGRPLIPQRPFAQFSESMTTTARLPTWTCLTAPRLRLCRNPSRSSPEEQAHPQAPAVLPVRR